MRNPYVTIMHMLELGLIISVCLLLGWGVIALSTDIHSLLAAELIFSALICAMIMCMMSNHLLAIIGLTSIMTLIGWLWIGYGHGIYASALLLVWSCAWLVGKIKGRPIDVSGGLKAWKTQSSCECHDMKASPPEELPAPGDSRAVRPKNSIHS